MSAGGGGERGGDERAWTMAVSAVATPSLDRSAERVRRPRTRRRLSRTVSPPRWREYRQLLQIALAQGYTVVSLETFLQDPSITDAAPVLILRHDVDQCPASALRMAAIENDLGVRGTYYFRWRTARAEVVGAIRDAGHEVGLHYETLSRLLLTRGLSPAQAPALLEEARGVLRAELVAFAERHGPTRSCCPHGDTRIPGIHNGVLLRDQDLAGYGIRWESNAAVGRTPLDVWLTDRSLAEGRWKDGLDPIDLLIDRRSPILAVIHPNNWVSGAMLWRDRVLPGRLTTGSDDPPAVDPLSVDPPVVATPVASAK